MAIYRTYESLSITGRWDAELLAHVPKSLRFLAHVGAGYDQIDAEACINANVRVSNVPTAVDDATADTGIFLMLGALRRFWPAMQTCKDGKFRGDGPPLIGRDPQGKTIGFLGMGGIGKNMAKKAKAFDMKIQYHNRTRLDEKVEQDTGAKYVSFDELLSTSDVLSLNLPLNVSMPSISMLSPLKKNFPPSAPKTDTFQPQTRHIISTAEFAKMKPGIVIVNTARGAVMDEAALVRALDDETVGAVGLDVFENEPRIEPGLLSNPRAIILPHMGTTTIETILKMEEWALANVRSAVEKGRLVSIIPEQKKLGWQ